MAERRPSLSSFATGSRRSDLVTCALIATFAAFTAPLLRVYYHVTVFDVRLTRINPDGSRTMLPTPAPLARPSWLGRLRPAGAMRAIEERIRRSVREDPSLPGAAAGTTFEWTVRWSANSPRLDHRRVFRYRAGSAEAP